MEHFTDIIPDLSTFITNNKIDIINKTDIYDIINNYLEYHQSEQPFYIVNLSEIIKKINLWREHLPNIEPFYAVKCNPDDILLQLMTLMDLNFDCASKNEIAKVISCGVNPDKIIYANPCKMIEQIKFARANDIDLMTFDSFHELYKIKLYHSDAKLILRIQTDDSKSRCQFNCKFGVTIDDAKELLLLAKTMDLNIQGVSFHVGSGCEDENVYNTAIRDCKTVYDMAKEIGYNLAIIDIGGGFPGDDDEYFIKIADVINNSINEYFYDINIKFIAEPGRFMVTSAYTLVTSVINKKIHKTMDFRNAVSESPFLTEGQANTSHTDNDNKHFTYYLSESVYGSFNNIIFDHAKIKLMPFNERNEKTYSCTIYGPTCDSMDKIETNCELPDLSIGETVFIQNMGAYTLAAASSFNGFSRAECKYYF